MSIFQMIAELEKNGEAAALCTIIDSKGSTPRHEGSKMLVFTDGRIQGSVGGGGIENRVIAEAIEAIRSRKTRRLHYDLVDPKKGDPGLCGGQVEVYVEPILPKLTLLVIGAGHVGRQVVHLAKWLGWHVVLSDDRAELCNKESIPEADEFLVCKMSEIPQRIKINEYVFIVATTRGSEVDVEGLPALLNSKSPYLGVIGSKRRWENTKQEICVKGDFAMKLAKVHSPIGLELHAETPEEIAVSIMAEVLSIANAATAKSIAKV
jgi:xanthine dehydrogenase accessory factor